MLEMLFYICWYTSVLNNLLNVIKSLLLLGEIFIVFLYCHPSDYMSIFTKDGSKIGWAIGVACEMEIWMKYL